MTTLKVDTPFGTRLFPTDLLFKNFFDRASAFQSNIDSKINHPVDIILKEEFLVFEIAAVGLEKKDIELQVEDGNCLKVSYTKPSIDSNNSEIDAGQYIHKGIAKRSFELGWKISPKFDLTQIDAKMEYGLLTISVPITPESRPKTIKIK
jgi:HSP20 family molecular chaperone IbpA|tara:strand:- start:2833 stop:3282 length:450 start_codon:yes stop_codon:yes gene_type:complete